MAVNPHRREPVRLERVRETAPPAPQIEHRRRGQALLSAGAGLVIGAVAGYGVVSEINPRQSAYRWGLVFALALIGLFIGGVLAETRVASDVDAPVRDVEAARRGQAATSVQGQLPGSPVRPEVTDGDWKGLGR